MKFGGNWLSSVVSEELFNNIMILYMLKGQGQGNIMNIKKIAF